MAAPSEDKIQRVRGRLYTGVNPAALGSAGSDFGGVPLGAVNRIGSNYGMDHANVIADEYGQTVSVIHIQRDFEVSFALRDWDPATLAVLFPNTVLSSGSRRLEFPGATVQSGRRLELLTSTTVLFVPDRAEHMGWLLYNAVPLYDVNEEVRDTILSEKTVRLFWKALRSSAYTPHRIARVGPLALLGD